MSDAPLLYLREEEALADLTMADAIAAVEEALTALGDGRAVTIPRQRTRIPTSALHLLQGALPEANLIGYKAYTSSRQGVRAFIHLFAADSGVPLAILEANGLGALRTGAAAAVAARRLARPEAAVVGLFGCGAQAARQLEGLAQVRPLRQVLVWARHPERLAAFCQAQSERLGLEVVPARTPADLTAAADILVTVTTSATPVLHGRELRPGQHINAVGSNALNRQELDEATIRRCDLIVVDQRETAQKECGDLLPACEKGRLQWNQLAELGEVLCGRRQGRSTPEQVSLFASQGLAVQDLAVAALALDRARRQGRGTLLPGGAS